MTHLAFPERVPDKLSRLVSCLVLCSGQMVEPPSRFLNHPFLLLYTDCLSCIPAGAGRGCAVWEASFCLHSLYSLLQDMLRMVGGGDEPITSAVAQGQLSALVSPPPRPPGVLLTFTDISGSQGPQLGVCILTKLTTSLPCYKKHLVIDFR